MECSRRIASLEPSATLAISDKARSMKADGIDVIGFGAGEPDFDTPDFIKEAAIRAIRDGKTRYTPATGIKELKDAIIKKFVGDNDIQYQRDQVVVSAGAKQSIFNIVAAICQEGDEVIVPAPYWVSYPQMVKAAGATPVVVECKEDNDFKLTAEELAAAITPRTKLLMYSSPSNPTGSVYERKELEALAEVLLQKQVAVLSDEIYEKLIYEGEHVSIASLGNDIKDLTFTINGVSKAYAMTGWRIGYAAGPQQVMSIVGRLQSHMTSNPNSVAQYASLAALTDGAGEVEAFCQAFRQRRDLTLDLINQIPGFTCRQPHGAFYAFPNVSAWYGKNLGGKDISNSSDLADVCLSEAQVAFVPGGAFGSDDFIRLSYALGEDVIRDGLGRLQTFLS